MEGPADVELEGEMSLVLGPGDLLVRSFQIGDFGLDPGFAKERERELGRVRWSL